MTFRLPILVALALLFCASQPVRADEPGLSARLETLAGQGNVEALYHLGMIYHLGLEGVARDPGRALGYFRRSAEGGDPLGAYKLGCYYAGQGGDVLAPDEALALRYKLVAAEAGYILAQTEVAQIYSNRGQRDRAVIWYEAAARQGDWTALFMAFFQVMPESPRPDRARAWLYFEVMGRTIAQISTPPDMSAEEVRSMHEGRAALRQALETGMSEAERAEGERLLSQWREERSPVTLRADLRLNAARRLVGLPDAS